MQTVKVAVENFGHTQSGFGECERSVDPLSYRPAKEVGWLTQSFDCISVTQGLIELLKNILFGAEDPNIVHIYSYNCGALAIFAIEETAVGQQVRR